MSTTDSPKTQDKQAQFFAPERIDLNASYFERHVVRKLGAQWDGYTWYIEQDTSLEPFYDFLPSEEQQKIDLARSAMEAQARSIRGDTVDRENFRESGQIYLQGIAETLIEQGYQAKDIEIKDYGIFQKLERGSEEITLHLSQNNDQAAIYRVSVSNKETLKSAYSPWQNAEITGKDTAIEKTVAYIAEQSPILAVKRAQKTAKAVKTEAAAEHTAQERRFIAVPYMERFEAKGLGARWDKDAKSWYVPEGLAPEPFAKWQQEAAQTLQTAQSQTEQKQTAQTATAEHTAQARHYIDVPYMERFEAKGLGARWDKDAKSWYVPEGLAPEPFAKWQAEAEQTLQQAPQAAPQETRQTLKKQTERTIVANPQAPPSKLHTKQTVEHIAPAQQAPNTDQKFWQSFYQRYDEAQMLDSIMADKPVYLAVPYEDRHAAKTLGAKWDKGNGSWYVPAGIDKTPLQHYLPKLAEVTGGKDIRDFVDAARSIGIQMDGFDSTSRNWQRLAIDGKHHRHKDGAVRLYDNTDGTIGGIARNLSTGAEITWSNRGAGKSSLGKEHKIALKLNAELRQQAMQEMRDTVAHLRGVDAIMLYQQLPPARGDEAYLKNKSMQHHSTLKRLEDGTVVMPILDAYRDHEGQVRMQIRSLQTISPEGEKKLMAQGEKSGGFFALPSTPFAYQNPERIIIAEGLATAENALQIAQAQQDKSTLAIVAVDCGNLVKVADKIAELYPHAEKIIAADNDRSTELKSGKNPGLEAARQVQAKHPDMPIFLPPAIDGKSTDWNDYLQKEGMQNAVKHFQAEESIQTQTAQPKTQHAQQHIELNIDGLCARDIGKAAYKAIDGDIRKLPELSKALAEKGYKLDEPALRAAAGHPITLQDAFTKAVSRAPVSKAPEKTAEQAESTAGKKPEKVR